MSVEVSHTGWTELVPLLEMATAEDHSNAPNYHPEKMERRWEKYKEFNILRSEGKPVAFAGVYSYGEGLVRVADRLYIFPEYRTARLAKPPLDKKMPALGYLIPYHTRRYASRYECFFSVQERRKRLVFRKHVELLPKELGYTLLPDMYWTTKYRTPESLQNIAATNEGRVTRALLSAEPSTHELRALEPTSE